MYDFPQSVREENEGFKVLSAILENLLATFQKHRAAGLAEGRSCSARETNAKLVQTSSDRRIITVFHDPTLFFFDNAPIPNAFSLRPLSPPEETVRPHETKVLVLHLSGSGMHLWTSSGLAALRELMSIRERLESITPMLEPRLQPASRGDNSPPMTALRNFPPLVLKSPHLMQILGLLPDLASVLYRLENAVPRPPVSHSESTPVAHLDLILRRIEERIHPWYPVLHAGFTIHFLESSTTGFHVSTISCLSHLVIAISSLVDNGLHSPHFEAALSMMAKVMLECSVTSVQCLVLFSVYQAYLLRTRQAYDYIQAAFLKIQPFLKRPCFSEGAPEAQLISRLYWTIYLVSSETSMHLNLSCSSRALRGWSKLVPLPSSTDMWSYLDDWNAPSNSSLSSMPQDSDVDSPNESPPSLSNFCVEVNLQQALETYAAPVMNISDPYTDDSSHPNEPIPNKALRFFPDLFSTGINLQAGGSAQDTHSAIHRAKYYMYEVTSYWSVIYRIILNGSADPELLPYGPLFFGSVTSFLSAAKMALWVCRPKAWFLCVSIYTISMATLRALDVRPLRLLVETGLWEQLEASVDDLQRHGELSPSVRYMWDSLTERLEKARG
ncbi:hypothetical protein BJY04DRAFT_214125 [Aspergillus karnatakaensis]|uniref:fungal specific transcription factor domain-containing protein n=1 Tax=Aspergillus karnatakaensis TaxID=1810916 RepID=UPI003CCD2603